MFIIKYAGSKLGLRWLASGCGALLLMLLLEACGAQNSEMLGRISVRQAAGVQLGGYEVIRYNAGGTADPALNGTLALRLDGSDLTISVHDSVLTTSVLLDVRYDAGRVHPVQAEFHGLLGHDSQVLSAAFLTQSAGLAGLGEVAIGGYKPGALSGDAVTIHFAPGALHTVSAVGIPYNGPESVGVQLEHIAYAPGLDNFTKIDGVANDVHVTWYCGWARADGNQDGLCNVGDLTPIGINCGKFIDDTNAMFSACVADYNDDGQVSISDLTPLGANFGRGYELFSVEGSDNDDAAPKSAIATLSAHQYTAATPPATYPHLGTIMKSWTIDFTKTSAFSYASLRDLDTNGDGFVRVWVAPGYSGPPPMIATGAYLELSVPPTALEIYPDPADLDWSTVTGSGTEADPYIIENTDLPRVYSLLADDKPGDGGDTVPVTDLTWTVSPQLGGVFLDPGNFEPNYFMGGYVYATDAAMTVSNLVYIEIHGSLP